MYNCSLISLNCHSVPGHNDLLANFNITVSSAPNQQNNPAGEISNATVKGGTLDVLLSTTYCRSQMYLSRQLAQLHPELTMPMFSGKYHSILIFFLK